MPVYGKEWRLLKAVGTAKALGTLGATPLRDEFLLPYPAGVRRKDGRTARYSGMARME